MTIKSWSGETLVSASDPVDYGGDLSDVIENHSIDLAVLSNSQIVATWLNVVDIPEDGPSREQKYRLFDAAGVAVSDEMVLTEVSHLTYTSFATVEALSNGGYAFGVQTTTGVGEAYYDYDFLDQTGATIGSFGTGGSQRDFEKLSLFTVGTGVWSVHTGDDFSDEEIARISFDNSGNTSLVTNDLLGPDVVAQGGVQLKNGTTSGGDVMVIFTGDSTPNSQERNLQFARFDATTGVIIGSPVLVADDLPGVYSYTYNLTALENGGFVISYAIVDGPFPGNSFDPVFQIYGPDGTLLKEEKLVNSYTYGSQLEPDVVALADGGFMVVWLDAARGGIYARSFDQLGNSVTADTLVQYLGASSNSSNLTAELMQDGRVVISWASESFDGGLATGDVGFKIVDPRDGVITGRFAADGDGTVDDIIYGSVAHDVVQALGGNDTVYGMAGNDLLFGDTGNDLLFGELGDDQLFGAQGDDTLNGGSGADLLKGGTGANLLTGGTGNDSYVLEHSATDVIIESEGEGTDTVFVRSDFVLAQGVSIELLRTIYNSGLGDINLTGNVFSQTIVGNTGDNILDSGTGGADVMRGGAGDDLYLVHNTLDVVEELANEGNDRVSASQDYTLGAGQHIETLSSDDDNGTSNLRLGGNELAQTIIGNSGNNHLTDGNGAADSLIGNAGDDTYRIFNSNTAVVEGKFDGADRVYASVDYQLTAGARVETVSTSTYGSTEALNLTGNEFNQYIFGNKGDNRLAGLRGKDTLNGAAGDDVFVFNTTPISGQEDRIMDYTVTDDQFELDASVFTAITTGIGPLPGYAFKSNSTGVANEANDRIIYETDTGRVYYDEDGTGAIESIVFAVISANLTMTASEFDIV